ncbi:MAG: hypothetical protein RLZZ501_2565 [Pseudomonadota bacterium]|jgi:hypothetical protein
MTETDPALRPAEGWLRRHVPPVPLFLARMATEWRLWGPAGLAVVVIAAILLVPADGRPGPSRRLEALVLEAPLVRLAPAVGLDSIEIQRRLEAGGIAVAHPGQSLRAIAVINHVEPRRLLDLALGPQDQAAAASADSP